MSLRSRTPASAGPQRAPRRALRALACACLALAGVAPDAAGHAVIQPTASRPAEQQVYALTIPNERDSDVVSVALQVPPEIDSLLVEQKPGWKVTLDRRGDRIAVVRWTGGRIAADQYGSFRLIARNPVRAGQLAWKVIQRYTNATDRWIGPPDSEQPAPRTSITEQAQPQNVINTEQGTAETPGAAATAPAAGRGDSDSTTVPIVLGVVALVIAIAALGVALASRRRVR